MSKIRIVHYINQFFAQIGGEEMAHVPPEYRDGAVGPGLALGSAFGDKADIVGTVICGDSYFNENMEDAKKKLIGFIRKAKPDLFIAGPAFNAGRYGVACGAICEAVREELKIPVLTGMYEENPGADMFRQKVYIIATRNSAVGMRDAVKKMSALALKLANQEPIGASSEEGYIPQGIRVNLFEEDRGSKRAVDMLMKKLKGKPFTTEYPMPMFDRVDPQPAVKDLSKAKIALVTSGGIVPLGNPDHIESSSATKYGRYDLDGVNYLSKDAYATAHGGYDPSYANADADRVLAVDVMREFEKDGKIGSLYRYFFSTVGNGTAVKNAKAFAEEFSKELIEENVQAVILTST